jgi:hypothetical protein
MSTIETTIQLPLVLDRSKVRMAGRSVEKRKLKSTQGPLIYEARLRLPFH